MTGAPFPDDAKEFRALFRNLDVERADGGFTGRVMHRVRRRVWVRRAVLGVALTIGAGFAAVPLLAGVQGLAGVLAGLAVHWSDPGWLSGHQGMLFAVLAVSTGPFAVRWLEQ